jgi:hypothetical protein
MTSWRQAWRALREGRGDTKRASDEKREIPMSQFVSQFADPADQAIETG